MPQVLTVQDLIRQEAIANGVPPALALAVAEQESNFNPTVLGSPIDPQGTRAIGTFQLLPSTAAMLGVDPHDPLQNIQGGTRYLKQLLDQYHGDIDQVLATYGGVKTDRTYVPSVRARLDKYTASEPAAAPAAPVDPGAPPAPPSGFWNSVIQGLDPNEAEGRRNIAGGVGAIAGGSLGALTAPVTGPWGARIGSVLGAGLAGGAEQLLVEETGLGKKIADWLPGSTDLAEPPPDPNASLWGRVARTGGEQAAYDVGGQVMMAPVRAAGRAALETGIGRRAAEYFARQKALAVEALQQALDSLRGARDAAAVAAAQQARDIGADTAARLAVERAALGRTTDAARAAATDRVGAARALAADQVGAARTAASDLTQEAIAEKSAGVRDAAATSRAAIAQARLDAENAAEELRTLHQANLVGQAPSEALAGQRVAEVFEGPGQAARDLAGQEVKAAAKTGPDVSIVELKKEAQRIMEDELLPPEQVFPREAPPDFHQPALGEGVVEGEIVGYGDAHWPATNSEKDLWDHVLDDAKAQGYQGPIARLRAAFREMLHDPLKGARALLAEMNTPHPDRQLLAEIARRGGLGPDTQFPGEMKWMNQAKSRGGKVHGVPGVVRPKAGLSFERMAELLRQMPGYEHFTSGLELVNKVSDIVQRGIPDADWTLAHAAEAVGIQPGQPWWQPFFQEQTGSLTNALVRSQQEQLIRHPAMGVIGRILHAPDTVDFYTAHLYKSQLQQALQSSYDEVIKSHATNITQHLTGLLRRALAEAGPERAGHAPYEAATAAYADIVKLFTEGHAPVIRAMAQTEPAAIAQAIRADQPGAAAMLVRVLTEQAEKGGGAEGRAAGERALRGVQEAWVHRNILQGPLDSLLDRVAQVEMHPDFMQAFLDTPYARGLLDNATDLGRALRAAQEEGALTIARQTELGRAGVQTARAAGEDVVGTARRFGAEEVDRATAAGQAAVGAARRQGAQEIRGARAAQRGGLANVEAQGAATAEAQRRAAEAGSLSDRQAIRAKGAELRQRRLGTPEERAFDESTLAPGYQNSGRNRIMRQVEWAVRATLAGAVGMNTFGPPGILLGYLMRSPGQASEADLLRYVVHSRPLTQAVIRNLFSPGAKLAYNAGTSTLLKGGKAALSQPTPIDLSVLGEAPPQR